VRILIGLVFCSSLLSASAAAQAAPEAMPDVLRFWFRSSSEPGIYVQLTLRVEEQRIEVAGCEGTTPRIICTRTRGFVLDAAAAEDLRARWRAARGASCAVDPPRGAARARVSWGDPARTRRFWLGASSPPECAAWSALVADVVARWERSVGHVRGRASGAR
jgi:hypothetical protein